MDHRESWLCRTVHPVNRIRVKSRHSRIKQGFHVRLPYAFTEIQEFQSFSRLRIQDCGNTAGADMHEVFGFFSITCQKGADNPAPFLDFTVSPRTFGRSLGIKHGTGLVFVRKRPHHAAQTVGIHPFPPCSPFLQVQRSVTVGIHSRTFRHEQRNPFGYGIVASYPEFGTVCPCIEMQGVHYVPDTPDRIIGHDMHVLIPVRTSHKDYSPRLYGAYQ